MSTAQRTNGNSQAAIFARFWEAKDGKVSRSAAREIVKLGFSQTDKDRMHELAVKNQEGRISAVELEELDNFIRVGDLMGLLQSKARQTLRSKATRAGRHG
jgi:hypothetical protein